MSSTGATIQVMEFVRAMALAWKNLAAYPPGHPALLTALANVNRALADLRGPAGEVNLGIANDGLIYGTLKVDSPSAQKFAHVLYTRSVAVLRFGSETSPAELESFLRLLAAGNRQGEKRALWDDLTAAGVININLQPVNYSAVRVTESVDEKAPEDSTLWDDILRALLENRQFSQSGGTLTSRAALADELSRMISQYVDEQPMFDENATFGVHIPKRANSDAIYRFLDQTIGEHIARASGFKKQHSLEQAVQLIRNLPDPLRRMVLRAVAKALASDDTAEALLRDFASELPADEVLDALRYLSSAGKLSAHALALLQSLTTVESSTRPQAHSARYVDDLVRLFADEDVHRFNPADHQELLGSVALHIPHIPPEAVASLQQVGIQPETEAEVVPQFSRVLFDLLIDIGPLRPADSVLKRLESVFRSHLSAGHFQDAFALIEQLQSVARETASDDLRRALREARARMATGETVRDLIESMHKSPAEAAKQIQRLTEALGDAAHRSLLVALSDEPNRSRRRRLFDFIASMGPIIVPEVMTFLSDERWFVLRNMIVLLRMVQDRTSLGEIRKLAKHPDLRVRMEAIKSLFALDPKVPATLLDDLFNDPDPKVAESAVTLVGTHGIREGVDPLLRLLEGNDVFGARRMIRVKALRALGDIGEKRALPRLERFLRSSMLPWPAKEERYVAWESLKSYPADARRPFTEKGLRSGDAHVRAICARVEKS